MLTFEGSRHPGTTSLSRGLVPASLQRSLCTVWLQKSEQESQLLQVENSISIFTSSIRHLQLTTKFGMKVNIVSGDCQLIMFETDNIRDRG